MPGPPAADLYESAELQQVTGPTLRPGGLELTRRALSYCDLPAGSAVVDIGCGTGATVEFLNQERRLKAFGLERSPTLIKQARNREGGLPLTQGTAERLPLRSASLAAVVCECVLSLVEDMAGVWTELQRVLAAGGYLVVTDVYARAPTHAPLLQTAAIRCCLRGARPREDLIGRVRQNGFSLMVWEDHSQELKRLAAQLAFAGWPLQTLWHNFGAGGARPDARDLIQRARPGYFLMVARKRG